MGIASLLNGTFGLFFSWSLLHIPPFILSFLSPHRKSHSSSVQVFTCLWSLLCLRKAGGLPPAIVLDPSSPCDSSLALGLSASLLLSLSSQLKCHMTHLPLTPGLKWPSRTVSQSLHFSLICVLS